MSTPAAGWTPTKAIVGAVPIREGPSRGARASPAGAVMAQPSLSIPWNESVSARLSVAVWLVPADMLSSKSNPEELAVVIATAAFGVEYSCKLQSVDVES